MCVCVCGGGGGGGGGSRGCLWGGCNFDAYGILFMIFFLTAYIVGTH